jgi:hypothetical protein
MKKYRKKPIIIERRNDMKKYRKKPIIIEAVQFDPQKTWPECIKKWGPDFQPRDCSWGYVDTLEGEMHVLADDWIIKGVNGEFYPCKPDIFKKSYDLVEDVEIKEEIKPIFVFTIGEEVLIGQENKICGTIASIKISGNNSILYLVTFWEGATYHEKWLGDFEIKPQNKRKTSIGFKNAN